MSNAPPKKRRKIASAGARNGLVVPWLARAAVAKKRRHRASPGISVRRPIVSRPQGGGIVAHLRFAPRAYQSRVWASYSGDGHLARLDAFGPPVASAPAGSFTCSSHFAEAALKYTEAVARLSKRAGRCLCYPL